MLATNEFKILVLNESNNSATFRIDPLPKGYANTLGTMLRRILLSSIPGAGIAAVKIDGVQHEYTTIAGLQDDVLSIVLNLKQVAVKLQGDTPVTLNISKKGKKGEATVVTAADIEKNALVEIINPDQVITTLADDKAEFNAEITVAPGIGYAMPDETLREEVGVIPVDPVFTPVTLVAVDSKNTRVGHQTDLDALEIKINTNGTISPAEALARAAEIMHTMSSHFVSSTIGGGEIKTAVKAPAASSQSEKVITFEDAELSTRLVNALQNAGYSNLNELEGLAEEELRNLKGMGEKSFDELLEVLKNNKINLI